METVRVGGRKYSDPDVISLIKATGRLVDPRSAVINQARQLYDRYRELGGGLDDSIKRLTILASLRGLEVQEMTSQSRVLEDRDAVLIPTGSKRGRVLYNPRRPRGRVAFSIAHEISHTFFPNSTNGARFRSICDSASREANELERLCDLGASELLMPRDEFLGEIGNDFGLDRVEQLSAVFGSSFESTVFRLASVHTHFAAAGLLRYRLRIDEERASMRLQAGLFRASLEEGQASPEKKYRRQSFFMYEACGEKHIVRWNKSFDPQSCVYLAGQNRGVIYKRRESLPNGLPILGDMEALYAPYQREDADPIYGDVLFFWQK